MTMVELIVVLAIVGLVSAVLVFNYGNFRSNVTLRGLSQQIALSIRKAQTYATSVRSVDGVSVNTTSFPGYGVSFSNASSSSATSPNQARFVLFADIPNSSGVTNGKYDNSGSTCGAPTEGNECVEVFTINSPDRITELCPNDSCTTSTTTVDIVFDRPAPDAEICLVSGSSCTTRSSVGIKIQSTTGATKKVNVWNTGQISIQ